MKLNKTKAGFTLIELVVVMVILGILAGIAVFKLGGSDEGAYLSTMKNDARGAIAVENNLYASYQEFGDADIDNTTGKTATTGQVTTAGGDSMTLSVSPYNHVVLQSQTCNDGTAGYTVQVTSAKTNKQVTFDSCVDGGIKIQ